MGRIDTLIIDNFKSYSGRHILGPFYNFTCIIGPNGSGKSNIMDAISFVLGVRSTQLRSINLNELIHKRDNIMQGIQCIVELIYEHNDNTTVTFKRRVDLKGISTYYINDKLLPYQQYNTTLESIGILVKVRNFLVYQGDVTEIANKSPQQFTELFEYISGSASLRDEYNQCKDDADRIEEEFIRIFEKKKNIQKEKKVIKQQKDEAERYNELISINKSLKYQFALTQLYYSDTDMTQKHHELDNHIIQLDERRHELHSIDTQIIQLQSDTASNKLESTATEKQLQQVQHKIDQLKPDQIKVKQSIEYIQRSIQKQNYSIQKLHDESIQQQSSIQSIQNELESVQQQQSELDELLQSEQGREFVIAENRLYEYNTLKLQAGKQLAQLNSELELLKRTNKTNIDRATQLHKSIDNLHKQQSTVTNDINKYNDDIERYNKSLADKQNTFNEKRNELNQLQQQHQYNTHRIDQVRNELITIQQYIASGDSIKSESKQQLRMNEAIDSLKLHLSGVHGRIANLIKPIQSRYKLAISVALGKHTNSIVVDDQRTAIECIKYLREQRIGVATFIPIDSIKTHTINESFRQLGGAAKLAYDCVEFDSIYERAISYALGNTLLVDTDTQAKSLAYGSNAVRNRGKIVVLNGTVLHKNNNITGGDKRNITHINDYNDKEYQAKQIQLGELRAELYKLDAALNNVRQIHQLELDCNDLTQQINNIGPAIKHCETTVQSRQSQLNDIQDSVQDKQNELDRINNIIDTDTTQIDELTQRIFTEENVIFAEFSRSVGVSNIREYEETHMKLIQQQTDKKLQLQSTQQRLQQQLIQLQSKDLQSAINKLQSVIDGNQAKLIDLKKEEKSITVEMTQYAVELDSINAHMEKLHHQSLQYGTQLKSLKHQYSTIQRDIDSIEKLNIVLHGTIKQLRIVRGELVRRCRLEQIQLPIVSPPKKPGATSKKQTLSAQKNKKRTGGTKTDIDVETSGGVDDDEYLMDVGMYNCISIYILCSNII